MSLSYPTLPQGVSRGRSTKRQKFNLAYKAYQGANHSNARALAQTVISNANALGEDLADLVGAAEATEIRAAAGFK